MSEFVTLLKNKWQTAKKAHKCEECHREIFPGEKYLYEAWVHEGSFGAHKTCRHCYPGRDLVSANSFDDGFVFGGLKNDLYDLTESIKIRLFIAGMNRKWKRRDGKMWRVFK